MIHQLISEKCASGSVTFSCSCTKFRNQHGGLYHSGYANSEPKSKVLANFRDHVRAAQAQEAANRARELRNAQLEANAARREAKLKAKGKLGPRSRRWRKLTHRSWTWKRTLYIQGEIERAFADLWEKECQPSPGLNFGRGLLQDLFLERQGEFGALKIKAEITNRDAMIAATVVQWLGTNCGLCFLRQALGKAGLSVQPALIRPENIQIEIQLLPEEVSILKAMRGQMCKREQLNRNGMAQPMFRRVLHGLLVAGFLEEIERPAGKFITQTSLGVKIDEAYSQGFNG